MILYHIYYIISKIYYDYLFDRSFMANAPDSPRESFISKKLIIKFEEFFIQLYTEDFTIPSPFPDITVMFLTPNIIHFAQKLFKTESISRENP